MRPNTTDKRVSPVIFDFLTSDMDLSGIEPPLEHVSLSDVHKRADNRFAVQYRTNENNQPTSFIGIDDGNRTVPPHWSPVTADRASNEALIVGPSGDKSTAAAADRPSTGQAPQGHHTNEGAARSETPALAVSPNGPSTESDEERKKLAYEEDQKRKWEGIDQWIYDEFHDFVELI